MGLVSERVPTMNMLKEAHELIEHANYYRVIKGLGTDYSNEWLDIDEDTLCAFREVSFLDEKRDKQIAARTARGERFSDWILDEVARFPSIDGAVETTHYGVLSLKENVNIFIEASPECGPQAYPQCIGLWTLLKTRRKGIDTNFVVISELRLLSIFCLNSTLCRDGLPLMTWS